MGFIRFNHVFTALMLMSVATAFLIPKRISTRATAHVRGVFAPIAIPFHRAASALHTAFVAPNPTDRRPEAAVRAENEYLRVELANLQTQLEALKRINADRELLGPLRPHCTPMAVAGTDTGSSKRESLLLRPSLAPNLRDDLPVIYPGGLVGRLDRVGLGAGPQVRLITDPGFRFTVGFRRFVATDDNRTEAIMLASTPQLIEGIGGGLLVIRNITERQVKEIGLKEGDWVVLDDPDWDINLQGLRIGTIRSIKPRTGAPQFMQLEVQPGQNLTMLREVMVYDRKD